MAEEDCPCMHNEAAYKPGEVIKVDCNTWCVEGPRRAVRANSTGRAGPGRSALPWTKPRAWPPLPSRWQGQLKPPP